MLAGFLLVLGGGLIALGARRDWLIAHLANNETATLNVWGSRFGNAVLVFAALIVVLGIARIARGYAKDMSLHRFASVASFAAIAVALARTGLFLVDHNLSIGSASSYSHLDIKLGIYLLFAGVAMTISSRLA